jgi:uncharacterized RDD family membrane protein YckC
MRRRRRTIHSPEHVPIGLFPAGLGSRYLAFLLDLFLIAAACAVVNKVGSYFPGVGQALVVTVCFLVFWSYPVLFEVLASGRTPGKRLLRLRVVDGRGLPIQVEQSFVRNVVRVLDMLPLGGLGMLSALLDEHHRRLGDLAADTLVVDEKPRRAPDAEAAGGRRHNSLRTPRIRRLVEHRLGLEERELLLALCVRAPELEERARYDLFESVGQHYRAALGLDDAHLSGEAVVRGLVALCYGEQGAGRESS